MGLSMPREERERYAKAVNYAVVERNMLFATADEFADWFTRVGWLFHGDDIAAGFAHWRKDPHAGIERENDQQ